jgi:polysaccharide export outer membrane protein
MKNMKKWIIILLPIILASCAQVKNRQMVIDVPKMVSQKEASTAVVQSSYYLSPGDELEVQFPYQPILNDRYTVRPDGNLSLAIIGTMRAAGKTPDDLQEEIRSRYQELSLSPSGGKAVKKEYRLNVGDELDIRFSSHKNLDELAIVRPDGKFSLPLIGEVDVEGITPQALEKKLIQLYKSKLNNPKLVVIVRKYTANYYYVNGSKQRPTFQNLDNAVVIMRRTTPMQIFVGGEVVSPTFFDYTGPVTAIQAIIRAGGARLSGETEQVAILRREHGKEPQLIIRDLKTDWVSRKETVDSGGIMTSFAGDFLLHPYDVLIVPKKAIAHLKDYLDQYLYDLLPALRNSSLSFVYELKSQKQETTVTNK